MTCVLLRTAAFTHANHLDLAGAYSALARGGSVVAPRAVKRVARAGSVADVASSEARRVMPADVAAVLTDVLSDPRARVAAFGERCALDLPFPVAAKTGTSKGSRDNWTVGFTREVTVAVWVGNFDGSPMRGTSGLTGAAPIFHAAMEAAMRGRAGRPIAPSAFSPLCPGFPGSPALPAAVGTRIGWPRDGARFVLDPDRERDGQMLLVRVEAPSNIEQVELRVDGRPAGRARAPFVVPWPLARREHVMVARAGLSGPSAPVTVVVE